MLGEHWKLWFHREALENREELKTFKYIVIVLQIIRLSFDFIIRLLKRYFHLINSRSSEYTFINNAIPLNKKLRLVLYLCPTRSQLQKSSDVAIFRAYISTERWIRLS